MSGNVRPESMVRITNFELANAFIEEQIAEVRKQVGDKKVLLALSGGVATGSELTLSRDDMVIDKLVDFFNRNATACGNAFLSAEVYFGRMFSLIYRHRRDDCINSGESLFVNLYA